MTGDRIQVLVVDDAAIYRRTVHDVLAGMPCVEAVGTAANGRIALAKIEQLRPDVITLDIEMPEMDGLEVLRHLRRTGSDVAVIMVAGSTASSAAKTVDALKLGAFDFVLKPIGRSPEDSMQQLQRELRLKLDAYIRSRQVKEILHGNGPPPPLGISPAPSGAVGDVQRRMQDVMAGSARLAGADRIEAIALGISTGGPRTLTEVLPRLPEDLAAPVLIVQHMPPVFTKSLAVDLDNRCSLQVSEAVDGQPVLPGHVLVAPGGHQMKVERRAEEIVVRITDDPPLHSCRPSVDYLFFSVAEVFGARAAGILMTGMGSDGVQGCREMKRRGSPILAQNEASCVVFGMPKAIVEDGTADIVTTPNALADEMIRLAGRGAGVCK